MEELVIRCRLGDIMRERGLSNKEVVESTGVSRNTITSLAANATKRIDYDTLAALCKGLDVTPGEILVIAKQGPYTRDENGYITIFPIDRTEFDRDEE